MTRLIALSGLILMLALAGCARHYTPGLHERFDPIPEFTSSNDVALVNTQASAEPYPLVLSSRGRYYANRKEWTDVAIALAARELAKRGMTVTSASKRTLSLSIESITSDASTAQTETRIAMRVEAGSGLSRTYVGRNSSVLVSIYERQVDGALMRAVAEMLKDPQIVGYLTQR